MKTFALLCMLWGGMPSSVYLRVKTPFLKQQNLIPKSNLVAENNAPSIEGYHQKAVQAALEGLSCLKDRANDFTRECMIIIDYSMPSSIPRLLVYDAKTQQVSICMHVAHGRGSGIDRAISFSNEPSSFKSSLGFFKIGESYRGKHGLAFRLIGLEPGINDKAYQRGIVIHSATYVQDKFIQSAGRAGRSLGCPAVSPSDYKKLIPYLQKESLLFIYAPCSDYFQRSRFFR